MLAVVRVHIGGTRPSERILAFPFRFRSSLACILLNSFITDNKTAIPSSTLPPNPSTEPQHLQHRPNPETQHLEPELQAHSAYNTLLEDTLPKAHLQPYNLVYT